jgi:hypothetical protein
MSRFLLNSAVLTREGTYEYRYVSLDEARDWLKDPFSSRLRFDATAGAIEALVGTRPPLNRTPVEMREGDEALVFRLTLDVSTVDKRNLTSEFIAKHCEVGMLTRVK